jgi:hypothetical protein
MNLLRWVRVQWDRVAAGACVVAGAIALVLGWRGVADETLTAQQLPYLVSGGIGGLFLLGLGGLLWLSADLRDEWRKLDDLEEPAAGRPAVDLAPPMPVVHTVEAPTHRAEARTG